MKTWTTDEIKNLLQTNDKMVMKSVVKIYERQTVDEKITSTTNENNGKGFNGTDAFIMTKFAEFYLNKGYLTEKQMAIARKKIMKYAKQLTIVANA